MAVPDNTLFNKSHEYVYEDNGLYIIGISEFGIARIGNIIYTELPQVGAEFTKGEIFATIESDNAATELYIPIAGSVIDVNNHITESPQSLNSSPVEDLWLIKVKSDFYDTDKADLLSLEQYMKEII